MGEETGSHAFVTQLHKHPKCMSLKEVGDGSSSECSMPGGRGGGSLMARFQDA